MTDMLSKTIRYKKEVSVPVTILGLRSLARHIKMDAGRLSSILSGKIVTSEAVAKKILKGIEYMQRPKEAQNSGRFLTSILMPPNK